MAPRSAIVSCGYSVYQRLISLSNYKKSFIGFNFGKFKMCLILWRYLFLYFLINFELALKSSIATEKHRVERKQVESTILFWFARLLSENQYLAKGLIYHVVSVQESKKIIDVLLVVGKTHPLQTTERLAAWFDVTHNTDPF